MSLLRFCSEDIVWQEVPAETSLAYTLTGCPVGCKGCHSVDSWPRGSGVALAPDYLTARLTQYQGLISCVLFLGGEWQPHALLTLLQLCKAHGLKTCLYTGLIDCSPHLKEGDSQFIENRAKGLAQCHLHSLQGLTPPTQRL